VVLLKLTLCRGERRLLLSHCSLRCSQALVRLPQRLVPLQERGTHHVDRRTAFRSLGTLV
jgi:hypothetical protein